MSKEEYKPNQKRKLNVMGVTAEYTIAAVGTKGMCISKDDGKTFQLIRFDEKGDIWDESN